MFLLPIIEHEGFSGISGFPNICYVCAHLCVCMCVCFPELIRSKLQHTHFWFQRYIMLKGMPRKNHMFNILVGKDVLMWYIFAKTIQNLTNRRIFRTLYWSKMPKSCKHEIVNSYHALFLLPHIFFTNARREPGLKRVHFSLKTGTKIVSYLIKRRLSTLPFQARTVCREN